jgi:hypothetical protein
MFVHVFLFISSFLVFQTPLQMTASSMSFVVQIVSIRLASILQSLQFSHIRLSALILVSIFHQAMVSAALTRNIIDSFLLMFPQATRCPY